MYGPRQCSSGTVNLFSVGEDPPRPPDGSVFQAEMAGYVPARGEFILEYDNYLELEVKDLDFRKEDTEEESIDRGEFCVFCSVSKLLVFSRTLLLARRDSTSHSVMLSVWLSVHGRTPPPLC